jgi:hypothetical protein
MRLIWITAALCVALTAPAFGLDYDCSPIDWRLRADIAPAA